MASSGALHQLPLLASATAKPLMQQIGNPLPVAQDSSKSVASAVKAFPPLAETSPVNSGTV